jgi:hypothetical protein
MSEKSKRRKTRGEAFENTLSPEQLSRLYAWCSSGTFKTAQANAAQEWNVTISVKQLNRWFHKDDDLKVLSFIATGAHMNRQIEEAYCKTPAPHIDTLVRLAKTLVMQLSVQGATDPDKLEVANSLFRSVLEVLKLEQKAEEFSFEREKFESACCEKFLEWIKDKRAQSIADSNVSNAEKIQQLRQTYFADVDALQKSGQVKLPA